MKFNFKIALTTPEVEGCLIIPVVAKSLTGVGKLLDEAYDGILSSFAEDLEEGVGSTVLVRRIGEGKVILISAGEDATLSRKDFSQLATTAFATAKSIKADVVTSWLNEVAVEGGQEENIHLQTLAVHDVHYEFSMRKAKTTASKTVITFGVDLLAQGKKGVASATAIANGIALARDLGNMPANICTPTYIGQKAKEVSSKLGITTQVMGLKQITALKMGSFLAVAQGSDQEPKFIVMQYKGGKANAKPIVLVGKGITFDSGGISIKPAGTMDEMKFDMCGAASVIGAISALAEMKAKVNVIAVVPTCENMLSGGATRPGDIVTTMSGQTVEILNTDAEGRLILCDALTYVKRFNPAVVVDVATLTGACAAALGSVHTGLFTTDDELALKILAAGKIVNDTCWRMPMDDDYKASLKSTFADISNLGSGAGATTAALFLAKFTEDYKWAHLDIAGTAWKSKASTGRPVPLLVQFVLSHV